MYDVAIVARENFIMLNHNTRATNQPIKLLGDRLKTVKRRSTLVNAAA